MSQVRPRAPENVLPDLDQPIPGRAPFDAVTWLTIYALVLMLIPSTLIFAPLGGAGTPATVLALGVTLWAVASWLLGRITPTGGGRGVQVAVLVLALAFLASFVAAMTRDIAAVEVLSADRGLILLASWAGLAIVAAQFITSYQRLDLLLRRLVIAGTVAAAIGILQFLGTDITQYIAIPGLSTNSADVIVALTRNGFGRPWGTATQPIEFGVVLAMLLPLAVQQAFDPAHGSRLRRWLPVALIAFTVPLTVSRSGVIGLGVTFAVLFPTWQARRRWPALGVIGLGMVAIHFLVGGLIGTFVGLFEGIFNGQDSSVQDRVADYSGVAQYISQRPLFGRGYGTFLPELYRFTDNTYLLGLVETGIVGIFALLFVFATGIQCAVAGRRATQDERRRELGQALVAAMLVATITSGTFDAMSFSMFTGLFFLLLGCTGAYRKLMTAEAGLSAPVRAAPVRVRFTSNTRPFTVPDSFKA